MKRSSLAVLALMLASVPVELAAQQYSGQMWSPNCSAITGWAWDATQPNTPIEVDVYNGGLVIATILANLYDGGYGNGYHAFSYPVQAV